MGGGGGLCALVLPPLPLPPSRCPDTYVLSMPAAREDHTKMDCFACVILSHGEEGYVYGKDGPIQIEKLIAPYKGHRCPTLAGKPKIFFIQVSEGVM